MLLTQESLFSQKLKWGYGIIKVTIDKVLLLVPHWAPFDFYSNI